MVRWLILVLRVVVISLKSRRNLLLENLALRHQLLVLNRTSRRPPLTLGGRALWAWLSQNWHAWKTHILIVQPDTVIRWHRNGFRLFWKWKSRPRKVGRKPITHSSEDPVTLEMRSLCFGGSGFSRHTPQNPPIPPQFPLVRIRPPLPFAAGWSSCHPQGQRR